MKYYTYIHQTADTGRIFYVGKGTRRDRATRKDSRCAHWHNIVNKHGFVAEVVAYWDTEEEAAMCDAQAKADSVYAAFGKSASRPLKGENLMAYRKRMARGLQAYSDAYKEVNLAGIKDAKLLEIAEKQIFADALAAAKSPTMYAADAEIEIHEKDRAGRMISKFKGGFGWMDAFKVPSLRVTEFKLNNNKR